MTTPGGRLLACGAEPGPELSSSRSDEDMNEKTVSIPNISCSHCAAAIRRGVGGVAGAQEARVDIDHKRATIRWQPPATWEAIKRALDEIGYSPAD